MQTGEDWEVPGCSKTKEAGQNSGQAREEYETAVRRPEHGEQEN